MRNSHLSIAALASALAFCLPAHAGVPGAPDCATVGGTYVGWPTVDPVWEMCWLTPGASSGPRGSGLEIRDVFFNGIRVFKRAHAPILFAEYGEGPGGTCYRDWKDSNSSFISEPLTRSGVVPVEITPSTTSCDISLHPTQAYGSCPFGQSITPNPGNPGNTANCSTGVSAEDMGDHFQLTTQYVAGWYLYTMRWIFYPDGTIVPRFGFGNADGTGSGTTHFHHNYWRFDFDIDGAGSDEIRTDGVTQNAEFTDLRDETGGPGGDQVTWSIVDAPRNLGYRVEPSRDDYELATSEPGSGLHPVDVLGTVFVNGEYSDSGSNNLGDCQFNQSGLVNGGDITPGPANDVVLYYRAGVRDTTGVNSMICKSVGPVLLPLGRWSLEPNNAPSFDAAGDQLIPFNAGPQAINAWATNINDNDPGIETLTFNVTDNTNPGLFATLPSVSVNGTLSFELQPVTFGFAMVTVTLTDDGGTADGGDDTSEPVTFMIMIDDIIFVDNFDQ